MGFKFGSTEFMIGSVKVNLDSIDTENLTAAIRVEIPVKDWEVKLSFHSRFGWNGKRDIDWYVGFQEKAEPEPEPEPDYDDEEHEDYESENDA